MDSDGPPQKARGQPIQYKCSPGFHEVVTRLSACWYNTYIYIYTHIYIHMDIISIDKDIAKVSNACVILYNHIYTYVYNMI